MEEILKKIVDNRKEKIKKVGFNFNIKIPEKRDVPIIIPSFKNGIIIAEIKRGSPSQGKIKDISNPLVLAQNYIESKINCISVLTEEDFFFGSLSDLILIKKNYPNISILRKDFILFEEEIEISYKCGADLILLIASILDLETIKKFKERIENYGMLPLIEVHNEQELNEILNLKPALIGINSRNLNNFKIDKNYPFALKDLIPPEIYVIYESGITNYTEAFFVGCSGFNGILVGTSIIKSDDTKGKLKDILEGFINGYQNQSNFYKKIFKKIYIDKKIVVKVCGITNIGDAIIAQENGADIIGFVFANSQRNISIEHAKEISKKIGDKVLKAGVVVDKDIDMVVQGVKDGWLDAIQFHNDFNNDQCALFNVCWYKAIRVNSINDLNKEFYSPIILYDAFSQNSYGGTGKTINYEILNYAKEKNINLYLAGGLKEDNIIEIINNFHPLLIDLSSGLEEYPGKKSEEKIKNFFNLLKKNNKI